MKINQFTNANISFVLIIALALWLKHILLQDSVLI